MGFIHKKILRPLLFRRDSEQAHNAVVKQLAWVSKNKFACGLVEKITARRNCRRKFLD